jgi:Fe(3+) dicitrate transport protein
MLLLFEFDLKKSGSFDFVFFKGYSIVEQNNITTGSPPIALKKIINLSGNH